MLTPRCRRTFVRVWALALGMVAAILAPEARADAPAAASAAAPVPPAVAPAPPASAGPATAPASPEAQVLEITFGSSQLFAHQSITARSGAVKEYVIPVTSALLMVERLLRPWLSVLSMFNLPLVTQKIIVNGEIREDYVAPSLALGARVSPLRIDIFRATRLELQVAALAAVSMGSPDGDKIFPLVAGRLHMANRDGFALYFGAAYAFKVDTIAVLYGIGHRF